MDDLISRAWVLAEYDRKHQGPPGGARKIMAEAPAIGAIPEEWLEYMQQESLSENDMTMVGAIEAIFIEWHIYMNRLQEMNRQKEQEAR